MDPKQKILIVDDTAMFRELGALFLARTGRVVTASSAAEGLAVAKQERPDVIIADLNMPGMDGDVLCKVIKSEPGLRSTPVVVVTSTENADDRARAVQAGADDVIAKPINRITLIEAVNRFLRASAPRGLKRVSLDADVQIFLDEEDVVAHARNLSRGGIFVESERPLAPNTRVQLEFQLPEEMEALKPTARVVWRRAPTTPGRAGMGLQFLALDRHSTRRIEQFVYEHADIATAPTATAKAS